MFLELTFAGIVSSILGFSTTLTVTVTMLKTPVNEEVSITFPVTITATPVQPTA